jgi:outer membrane murein-binding lipoprotein Lpp
MNTIKLFAVLCSVLLIGACSSADRQGGVESSAEAQLITESDSLSNELSAAGDSVEKKMNDLQTTLESLNN